MLPPIRLVILLALVAAACARDEPQLEGKPLSYWKREATQVSTFSFWNSDRDARRRIAFQRLSSIGEPAIPVLLELLRHEQAPVSGSAFNALANLGPRAASAVPQLTTLLDNPAPAVRIRAAWILGSIGPAAEPAVPRLERMLSDTSAQQRNIAERALAGIRGGDPRQGAGAGRVPSTRN